MAFIFPAFFAKCRNGSILYDKETAALRTGGLLLFVFLTRSMGHVDKKDTRYKRGHKTSE
mgnify:CR=1 FL=1